MLTVAAGVRVYVAPGPTDMRKSFTGLIAATEQILRQEPLSGHLFAFCNRRRNLLKLLYWDGSGFWILAKRLEQGTFDWPTARDGEDAVTLELDELGCLLGGLELRQATRRSWWRREPSAAAS